MNPASKFSPSAKQSGKQPGTLRWLLSFSFFLALFALLALLVSYGVISLNGTDKPAATAAPPSPAATPAAQASESPVLPSGTTGHAAAAPSPQR